MGANWSLGAMRKNQLILPVSFAIALILAPRTEAQVGDLDAVFGNTNTSVNRVCFGDGMGGFTCNDVSTDANSTEGVALGFVDDDDYLDAVFANISNQRNRVCFGDGLGGFSCADVSTDQLSSFGVALGFVVDNGDLDAVFANGQMNRVCLGDGVGLFSCSNVSMDIRNSAGVALGIVDDDGSLDAVFANTVNSAEPSLLRRWHGGLQLRGCEHRCEQQPRRRAGFVYGDANLDAVFANIGRNRVCFGNGGRWTRIRV